METKIQTILADFEVEGDGIFHNATFDNKTVRFSGEINDSETAINALVLNMQKNPTYTNVTAEIINYFQQKIKQLQAKGIQDIIIDPGFGFGKTLAHNYQLLNELEEFKQFGIPILVGTSRKSMIYKLLDNSAEQALNGTSITNTIALQKGVNILRVHDVKEAIECIKITTFAKNNC